MKLSLRANASNISSTGLCSFTLPEAYDINKMTLMRVISDSDIAPSTIGIALDPFNADPILYAQFNFKTDCFLSTGSANKINTICLGFIVGGAYSLLINTIDIITKPTTLPTAFTIQLYELNKLVELKTDISKYYRTQALDDAGEQDSNHSITFDFDIELSNHQSHNVNP